MCRASSVRFAVPEHRTKRYKALKIIDVPLDVCYVGDLDLETVITIARSYEMVLDITHFCEYGCDF